MIDVDKYGPWAFVAGGSEGVVAGFAEDLAKAGLNLVLLARKPGPLEGAAAKARAHGVEVRTLAVDLLAADAVERIRETTADREVGLLIINPSATPTAAASSSPETSTPAGTC